MPSDETEAPTQWIRRPGVGWQPTRPIAPLPAGLDPSRSSDTGRVDDTTDVMSLDELMDLAAAEPTVTMPSPPPPAAAQPVAAQPAAPRRQPRPRRAITVDAHRALADARRALVDVRRVSAAGIAASREWLETNDNALIAATVLVTLLLLIAVAAL